MHVDDMMSSVVIEGMLLPEEIMVNMMKILQEERLAKKMNYEDFSAASGLHRTTIPRYESGAVVPTVVAAINMAHALDLHLSDVLRKAESMGTKI